MRTTLIIGIVVIILSLFGFSKFNQVERSTAKQDTPTTQTTNVAKKQIRVTLYSHGKVIKEFTAFDNYFCYNDSCSIKSFYFDSEKDPNEIITDLDFVVER